MAFRPARAKQGDEKAHNLRFLRREFDLLLVAAVGSCRYHHPSRSLLRGSHGTRAVAHQALPFAAVTDGAFVCALLCTMFPADLGITCKHMYVQ